MDTSIHIRAATAADAALLAEMGARAFTQAFGEQNTPENLKAYLGASFSPQVQASELAQAGSVFLIAESEGTLAGYARLLVGSKETCITGSRPVELVRFYALQEWIGKGLGGQLMQACIDTARSRGGDVLWLGVWEKNARAIKFYQKWGFVEVGRHPFKLGTDLQMDWIMQRGLALE